jgi:hypothetical protein
MRDKFSSVLVNLNGIILFEIFQTSRVTYRHCLNEALLGRNTSYKWLHLVSYGNPPEN